MTLTAPPPLAAEASRWRRVRQPALVIGGLAAITVALNLRDPHQHGSWGLCPSASLLGFYCPGCGGLRAVNDLTHGQVGAAASSNLFFVVALPFLVAALAAWLVARWRGGRVLPFRVPRRLVAPGVWSLVTVLVAFTVLRNLPGSWLAP